VLGKKIKNNGLGASIISLGLIDNTSWKLPVCPFMSETTNFSLGENGMIKHSCIEVERSRACELTIIRMLLFNKC